MIIESKPKESAPEGTHTGRLYSIVDLGTQRNEFEGEVKIAHRIRLDWELSEEKMADGRPFSVGKEYTASTHTKSTLAQMIKGWKGIDISKIGRFDIDTLLGEPCNITVIHNDKGYANIATIAPLKKSEIAPGLINPLRKFCIAEYKATEYSVVPEFLKEKIRLSPEYQLLISGQKDAPVAPDELDDGIPF